MPTPLDDSPLKTNPKWTVFRNILDYVRAMRTGPTIPPDEAAEWVALEQEFTTRTDEISNPT